MQEKIPQHYRVTLDRAKQDYQDGLLTATGLVYYAVAILRPPGQKLRVKKDFANQLGIDKCTFYRALSKLKLKNQVEWQPTEGLDLWIPLNNGVISISHSKFTQTTIQPETDTALRLLQSGDSQLQIGDSQLQIGDNRASKPSLCKGSRDSPDITDTYQIFLSSLTNEERENFETFSREAVAKLPVKPVLTKKWIAYYHQDLWKQYKGTAIKREPIEMPNLEQMTKLQELQDAGKIKKIYPQRYKNGETIAVDTGSKVSWWWEILEPTILEP